MGTRALPAGRSLGVSAVVHATPCPSVRGLHTRLSCRGLSTQPAPAFRGVYPIMATPFRDDETVDVESFAKSIAFMASAGCDGVTIIGVLGESNRLVDRERELLIRTAVDAAPKGFPIVVGTSHPGTAATTQLSQMAKELGASGVMVTPSREPAPIGDARMMEYFGRVAEGVPGFPIVLQDHPASTQVHMSLDLLARLCLEIPQIECVKLESPPTPARIAAFRELLAPHDRQVSILTGLGALYGLFELEAGGDGL